jgi:uncharacterized protein YoxC
MKVELKDAKLKAILEERGKVLEDAKKLQKEVEELQKNQAKLGYKMNRLKDKTQPLMDKQNIELKEFDYVARLFVDKGKVYAEIKNQVEDYKQLLREKNAKDNSDNSSNK